MKKVILFTILFFTFLSGNYAQHNKHTIGIKSSLAVSYLHPKHSLNGNVPVIYPLLPNIEANYLYQKDNKTSFLIGAGVGHVLYYSQYTDDFFPNEQYIDNYFYVKIPAQYRKNLKDWLYVGAGANARITLASTSRSTSSALPRINPAYDSHKFQLEAVGTAGLKFDFWKFSYHLGLFTEIPVIHREYINVGLDTGLFFNF